MEKSKKGEGEKDGRDGKKKKSTEDQRNKLKGMCDGKGLKNQDQ